MLDHASVKTTFLSFLHLMLCAAMKKTEHGRKTARFGSHANDGN